MLNEYLLNLKNILQERNVKDVDDIIDYFNEMINDRLDNGESIDQIIESLGDVNELANNFAPDQNIPTKVQSTNNNLKYLGIEKLKIENISYNYHIIPSNNDELSIEYDEDSSTNLSIKQIDNVLKIEQEYNNIMKGLFNRGFNFNNNNLKATIYLPKHISLFEFENVTGDLTLNNQTIDNIDIENVSGDIKLDDINCQKISLESVSGDVLINNIIVKEKTSLEIVSGDIKIDNIKCSKIKAESVSGDIDISIVGRKQDTNIQIEKLMHEEKHVADSDNYLKFESVTGDLKYSFLND